MRRLRPATILVLAGLAAAAYFVVSSQGTTTRTVAASPGTAEAWRGLVGTPRPPVAAGQRVLVVLKAPSLASQVAAAGGLASDVQERGFTAAALAAQHQVVSKLAAKGAAVRPEFRYTRLLNGFSAVIDPHSLSIVERSPGVEGVYPVRAAG